MAKCVVKYVQHSDFQNIKVTYVPESMRLQRMPSTGECGEEREREKQAKYV
jgi:hypothetical protein